MLFEVLDHADVGDAARAAAGEHQPHAWALRCFSGRHSRRGGRQEERKGQQGQKEL